MFGFKNKVFEIMGLLLLITLATYDTIYHKTLTAKAEKDPK